MLAELMKEWRLGRRETMSAGEVAFEVFGEGPSDKSLHWLERPVCLEWSPAEEEARLPMGRFAGASPAGMVMGLVRVFCSKLSRKGRCSPLPHS